MCPIPGSRYDVARGGVAHCCLLYVYTVEVRLLTTHCRRQLSYD